jgi:protocatechuate 3,4-dioxygenase beta subunit
MRRRVAVIVGLAAVAGVIAWWSLREAPEGQQDVVAAAQPVKTEVRLATDEESPGDRRGLGFASISGTVREQDGKAIAGAKVCASDGGVDGFGGGVGAVFPEPLGGWFRGNERPHLTDADGRFSVEELFPGKYSVRAFRRGGGEAIVEHVELGSEVALTIAATGRVAGEVALAGGGAPQEFRVTIEDRATGYRRTDSFFRTAGAWSFAEVPPGNFKIRVTATEGTQELDLALGAGEERSGVRVELVGKVTLRGTVVDVDGAPVPGVAVRVSGTRTFVFGGESAQKKHVSDAAGRFEVEQVPSGSVTVMTEVPRGDEHADAVISTKIAGGPVVELPPIRLARRTVKPGEASGDLGITLKREGPGSDWTQRRLIVAVVRPGGPAAAAGVQVGDEIVAVGGQDVSGANVYLYDALSRVPPGTAVRLGLARGVTVEVTTAAPP